MLKTIISTLIGSVLVILYRLSLHSNYIIVHLVPHSHDDVGWLKTPEQYFFGMRQDIQRACVRDTITTTMEQLAKDPSRKFIQVTISISILLLNVFYLTPMSFPTFQLLWIIGWNGLLQNVVGKRKRLIAWHCSSFDWKSLVWIYKRRSFYERRSHPLLRRHNRQYVLGTPVDFRKLRKRRDSNDWVANRPFRSQSDSSQFIQLNGVRWMVFR